MEGSLHLQIDWASLTVRSKFTVLSNFPSTSPQGAYIWRGNLMEGFLHHWFGGLIFGGAYFWNFTVYRDVAKSHLLDNLTS